MVQERVKGQVTPVLICGRERLEFILGKHAFLLLRDLQQTQAYIARGSQGLLCRPVSRKGAREEEVQGVQNSRAAGNWCRIAAETEGAVASNIRKGHMIEQRLRRDNAILDGPYPSSACHARRSPDRAMSPEARLPGRNRPAASVACAWAGA